MQSLAASRLPSDIDTVPPPAPSQIFERPPGARTRSGLFPIASGPRAPQGTEADDAALVGAACAGDQRAYATIWRKYAGLVRCKVGLLGGGQDADDHVQEVFVRLFARLPDLRDPNALRSFVIGIALRVVGTELRRRRCRHWLTLTTSGELPDIAGPSFDGSDAREMVARFAAIVDRLTPHSARVFELRYVEDMELVDVARAMGISLATAKRHLARASACVFAMAERDPGLSRLAPPDALPAYDAAS